MCFLSFLQIYRSTDRKLCQQYISFNNLFNYFDFILNTHFTIYKVFVCKLTTITAKAETVFNFRVRLIWKQQQKSSGKNKNKNILSQFYGTIWAQAINRSVQKLIFVWFLVLQYYLISVWSTYVFIKLCFFSQYVDRMHLWFSKTVTWLNGGWLPLKNRSILLQQYKPNPSSNVVKECGVMECAVRHCSLALLKEFYNRYCSVGDNFE